MDRIQRRNRRVALFMSSQELAAHTSSDRTVCDRDRGGSVSNDHSLEGAAEALKVASSARQSLLTPW